MHDSGEVDVDDRSPVASLFHSGVVEARVKGAESLNVGSERSLERGAVGNVGDERDGGGATRGVHEIQCIVHCVA